MIREDKIPKHVDTNVRSEYNVVTKLMQFVREVSTMDGDSEYYKEQIIEMVKGIESQKILRLIYGFVRRGYREENAGK